MKLYGSSRSPFVRKALIAAHETGFADCIVHERVRVMATEPNRELLSRNPLGKIPTLVLDDGKAIYDSSVICAWFDRKAGGGKLIPADPEARLDALQREALGDGFSETLLSWLLERIRRQEGHSEKRMAHCRIKAEHVADLLESTADEWRRAPFDVGHIGIGAAFAYMDFRFSDVNWREGRPRLAAWHAEFSARPSAVATRYVDDLAAAS